MYSTKNKKTTSVKTKRETQNVLYMTIYVNGKKGWKYFVVFILLTLMLKQFEDNERGRQQHDNGKKKHLPK